MGWHLLGGLRGVKALLGSLRGGHVVLVTLMETVRRGLGAIVVLVPRSQ